MALVVKDRVQETSTTTGTGSLTLLGAVTGFQTFSSAIGNTNTTYYTIQADSQWEVGIGTVSAGALSRDTVLESSNSGSLVDFSAGTKFVFCTYPAEKSVDIETAQTLTNKTISADNNTLSGIAASSFVVSNASGNIDGSAAQKTIPSGVVVGTTDSQTLTNKTISGASNTLSNIANTSLTNSAITINGTSTSLGGSINVGTVTSVGGTGSYGGLTLSGTVTSSGNITLGGTPTGTWPISVSGNAATVTNGLYTTGSQTVTGTKAFQSDNTGMANGNGGLSRLEVIGTGAAAFMSFHRPGAYATYFGIDSDNQFKIGGWSLGGSTQTLLTSSNYGNYRTFTGDITVGAGGASTITMVDTDEGNRLIHCNSNRIGFLNQSGGWGSYCNDDGSWASDSRIYTGWDSGAANSVSCSNWFRSTGNTGWYSNDYGGGIWMTDSTFVRVYNNKSFLVDGNLHFNSGYGSAGIAYGCRAWVNFNGTGTVAIRASGNVSSITDNGTGQYTVNFTTAMPDANYVTNVSNSMIYASNGPAQAALYASSGTAEVAPTTSAARITITTNGANYFDAKYVLVSIYR